MNSSIAPPPTGGNGKYVAVLLLLLGGMAALLYWKFGSGEPQKPVALSMLDAAAGLPTSHIDDDVPPPPPMPEAGPDTGPVKAASTGGGPPVSQCAAPQCAGKATPDLESALAFRAKQAHRCYDTALAQDPTLKGRVGITVRVASSGQVCSANVATNELGGSTVAQCVANMFRQAGHFPPPAGGCVDATVPISFVPSGH